MVFAVAMVPQYLVVRKEVAELTDAHVAHDVSHPGWSFPAVVYSAPAALDLPEKIRIEHAKVRGYTERCPPEAPGEFCAKDGAVIPRGGHFPEGDQPPGKDGWTRPLAFEPVRIGTLIGPEGEIRWHLAHSLTEIGEHEDALAEYERVQESLPGYEDVAERITALRRVLGRS